jgi:putative transposase
MSRMCAALKVSRSGYYDWLNRPESERRQQERALLIEIRSVKFFADWNLEVKLLKN